MSEITFIVHPAEEGGYWAEAEGYPLFTQGESLDELSVMVRDAVECFFPDPKQRPGIICWRFAEREVAA
jgi:hypothetical protein